MSKEKREDDVVTRYWLKHYVRNRLCSLCGQRGVIDTSGTTSPKGVECGRVNYCICPNGQKIRAYEDRVARLRVVGAR